MDRAYLLAGRPTRRRASASCPAWPGSTDDQRGYISCDVGRDEWRTSFMVMDRVRAEGGAISKRLTATTARGQTPGLALS